VPLVTDESTGVGPDSGPEGGGDADHEVESTSEQGSTSGSGSGSGSGSESESTPDGRSAWDPDAYDDGHAFVYEYGGEVLELLDPAPGERILDLGCGTGHLTAELADRVGREDRVVGIDRDAAMLREARAVHPAPSFVRGDARAPPVTGGFDAVFSNAALHWVPERDQPTVAARVAETLRPGGRFVAELGGVGNVDRIVRAVRAAAADLGYEVASPWYFPTVGEHARLLERAGFEVRVARLFDRPTPLEGGETGLAEWLSVFGEDLLAPVPPAERAAVVTAAAERLRPDRFREVDGGSAWIADYRRLRFLAVRPVEG
jgi:trans-aconitate methyltransferase